jgi:uncharacterized membrane protein
MGTHGAESKPITLHSRTEFWYSKRQALLLLALIFLLAHLISYLIPPFQSPDEIGHVGRAYLLSKGELLWDSEDGALGGKIDTGLLSYGGSFFRMAFRYERKVTNPSVSSLRTITWSEKRQFEDLSNTVDYFPLPYIPQAFAFMLGEKIGLTVSSTYYLARLLSLIATLGLLCAALLSYEVPLFVLALFFTPMTLFQLGSASLDSVSFGTTVLAASLFMRGSDTTLTFNARMHFALAVCIFLLATSRIYLFPLTILPAFLTKVRHSRAYLASAAVLFILSLCWILFAALKVVHDNYSQPDMAVSAVAIHYLTNLGSLFRALFSTLTSFEKLRSYWSMFVGILGWLDTPLATSVYITFGVLLLALSTISLHHDVRSLFNRGNLTLAFVAAACLSSLFLIGLFAWSPYPTKVIEGIQGRYFTPILIFLGFSVFSRRLRASELKLGFVIVLIMISLSVRTMIPTLLNRYWIYDPNVSANYAPLAELRLAGAP